MDYAADQYLQHPFQQPGQRIPRPCAVGAGPSAEDHPDCGSGPWRKPVAAALPPAGGAGPPGLPSLPLYRK